MANIEKVFIDFGPVKSSNGLSSVCTILFGCMNRPIFSFADNTA